MGDAMKVLSVNVGPPRPLQWGDQVTTSGIFKKPVQGPVNVRRLNLDGDEQADLTVHGGIHKAVYAYPSEHYPFWRKLYPSLGREWGAFGENLTTKGINEASAGIGDKIQIGSVVLTVVQPRLPCYKLAAKFDDDTIIRKFTEAGRNGIYFSVDQEGQFQAGDAITWIHRESTRFTIADAMRLLNREKLPVARLRGALQLKDLTDSWRKRVMETLALKSQK